METIKKNRALVLGILIPIVMILVVAASIYLPGLFVKPQFNFVYESGSPSRLYVHDVEKNESTEISTADTQTLNLDANATSPDNFEIVQGSYNGGMYFFFWGGGEDYRTRYLKGHNVSKKLNLQLDGDSYREQFRFVGWIK